MGEFEGTNAQRDVNTFLTVVAVMVVLVALELIWGAQWRWLATTTLLGVAVSLAVPLSGIMARRAVMPNPILRKPTGDPDAPATFPVSPPSPTDVGVDPSWPDGVNPGPEYFTQRVPVSEALKPYSPVGRPPDEPVTRQFPRDPGEVVG
jgi:hypothetical protein